MENFTQLIGQSLWTQQYGLSLRLLLPTLHLFLYFIPFHFLIVHFYKNAFTPTVMQITKQKNAFPVVSDRYTGCRHADNDDDDVDCMVIGATHIAHTVQ